MNKELIDLLRKHVDMWREIDQLFLRAESTQLADKAADALEAADKRIASLEETVCFFAGVIKCAEPWSKHCEKAFREALKQQVDG